jgi:hypothetical protein
LLKRRETGAYLRKPAPAAIIRPAEIYVAQEAPKCEMRQIDGFTQLLPPLGIPLKGVAVGSAPKERVAMAN